MTPTMSLAIAPPYMVDQVVAEADDADREFPPDPVEFED